jgi:molybdate/tungstate transport system permease protein
MPETVSALLLSLGTATVSTLILSFFGIPLAYALARYQFKLKFLLRLIVILPLVVPPLASGAMLLGVFGPYSFLGRIIPFDLTQSVLGIIIAQTYVASPFIILPSQAAFEAVPEKYETMARVLGKKKSEVFFRISLPLAKTGILVGMLMAWIRSIGELGATLMLAYNPHTISIQIFEDNAIGGIKNSVAGIVWVIILSIMALTIFLFLRRNHSIKLGWYR